MTKSYKSSILICLVCLFFFNILVTSSFAPNSILKQIISWLVGFIMFFLCQNINLKQIKYYKWPILIFILVLLISPLIFGQDIRGSRRWIGIGFFKFQPSEIVKPWLASLLAATSNHFLVVPAIIITLIQPDLGTSISIMLMLLPLYFYHQSTKKHLSIFAIVLVICFPLIWQFGLRSYQKDRISSFLKPQSDPLGKGYNLIQSQIAIGSAGLLGKGYRQGTQGQLLFLPEKHTDFIFAALTEELGLIGSFFLITLYFLIIKILIEKAYQNQTNFEYFIYTLIIATQIWSQAFINIGMNIGILPVTGIPLPFMSVGGSSIITLLLSLGIVFSN